MSGRIQHHFWKFMQDGFVGKGRGNGKNQIWVYQKDKEAFPTNPRNHGAVRDFYVDREGDIADEVLTKTEGQLAPIVTRMRNLEFLESDVERLPDLISHLEVRSKFLRQHITTIIEDVIDNILESMTDQSRFAKIIHKQVMQHPEWIDQKFKENNIPPEFHTLVMDFMDVNLLTQLKQSTAKGLGDLAHLFGEIKRQVKNSIMEAQNNMIANNAASPKERAQMYACLHFELQAFESGGLILPDTCVLHVTKSDLTPMLTKGQVLQAVILPISDRVMVIGSQHSSFQRSIKTINSMLASVSFESFVTSTKNPIYEKLKGKIGRNARIISSAEITRMTRNLLD
jgi:hypothetical protein